MSKRVPSKQRYINREISWLSFNERVLQEAVDPKVPVLERLRFLGIFSNNQDEFFRVRVATLKRLVVLGKKARASIHYKPKKILADIQKKVMAQSLIFDATYKRITAELRKHNIYIVNERQLNRAQSEFVKNYFHESVRPLLVPVMLKQTGTVPNLSDRTIYLAIKLSSGKFRPRQYALLELPEALPRFLLLPGEAMQTIILLDDIVRHNLHELFAPYHYEQLEAYTIKLTRDAELDIDNDVSRSFVEKISRSVKNRQKGNPVRLVYDSAIPRDLLEFLRLKLKVGNLDNMIPGGRYHNFKDFIQFPKVGSPDLRYQKTRQLRHKSLPVGKSFFDVLRKQDVMLHYPYHTFDHFIDLLREAAIDPDVKSIRITLYRLAKNSRVINALVNAARNGKQVTAVVEVQARFDEEANIRWANQLQEEGIQVIHGVPGLKVHAKLCLIQRREGSKTLRYVNVTTGNYNEMTAGVYADDALFTSDQRITHEVESVFEFLEKNYKVFQYKHLVLSPNHTRKRFKTLIEREMLFAEEGKPAFIILKMNSLVDEEMIEKLYAASRAGVKIRLIIRGICALVPGVPGLSENIEAVSIVDKFLEHSRIFLFHHGGENITYLSSADWMARNLDHRIEVSCPVYDKQLKEQLRMLLEIQWSDNVKARVLNRQQDNTYRNTESQRVLRAQEKLYAFLKQQ